MNQQDNKIFPKDVFITTLRPEEQKWIIKDKQMGNNRPSGNSLMDKLAGLINVHGMKTAKVYDKMFGAKAGNLQHLVRLVSGLSFTQWRDQYIVLATKELLVETDYKLDEIAKRLGFSGINSFSKWYIRIEKESPSTWRYFAKRKRQQQERELFVQLKKQTERPII